MARWAWFLTSRNHEETHRFGTPIHQRLVRFQPTGPGQTDDLDPKLRGQRPRPWSTSHAPETEALPHLDQNRHTGDPSGGETGFHHDGGHQIQHHEDTDRNEENEETS